MNAALKFFALVVSTALAFATPAWAGKRISVPSLHFSIELPDAWVDVGGKGLRESLAKRAAQGKPLSQGLKHHPAYTEIVSARTQNGSVRPKLPSIKVHFFMYGDVGKRDAVRVANEWMSLEKLSDRTKADVTPPEEYVIDGKPAAITRFNVSETDPATNETVDFSGTFHTMVFDEYFIVVSSMWLPDADPAEIAKIEQAIASIKLN